VLVEWDGKGDVPIVWYGKKMLKLERIIIGRWAGNRKMSPNTPEKKTSNSEGRGGTGAKKVTMRQPRADGARKWGSPPVKKP